LVPASIIARELEIRLVDTICISSYDYQQQEDITVLKAPEADSDGWLLIDDLVDTGKTARVVRNLLPKAHFATVYARVVRNLLPKAHFATVYAKPAGRPVVDTFITEVSQDTPAGRPVVDTFITEVSQDTWILFPWDTESQFVEPIVSST